MLVILCIISVPKFDFNITSHGSKITVSCQVKVTKLSEFQLESLYLYETGSVNKGKGGPISTKGNKNSASISQSFKGKENGTRNYTCEISNNLKRTYNKTEELTYTVDSNNGRSIIYTYILSQAHLMIIIFGSSTHYTEKK